MWNEDGTNNLGTLWDSMDDDHTEIVELQENVLEINSLDKWELNI